MVFWRKNDDQPTMELCLETDELLREALSEYNESLDTLRRDWSFDRIASWTFDQASGKLIVQLDDKSCLIADAQALGSFDPASNTWEWAWNVPTIDRMISIDTDKLKQLGISQSISYLATPIFTLPESSHATYLAAVGQKVTQSQAVFAAPTDTLIPYLLLKNLRQHIPDSETTSAATRDVARSSTDETPAEATVGGMTSQLPAGVHTEDHDVIELRRLHRFFGNTRAVDDISFSVPRGRVFGYIGPNGAGKTTSMRILATLDVPTYGDAYVDGFSVINDPDLVRRRLGFMPDAFGTYTNVNCAEYLDFYARAYGLAGRERHQALRRVMSFTGLDKLADKPITGLSKGMKQRLCLGRSMVHGPSVLILDEPAAGLDPRARIELREMIGQLAMGEGKTVLVSSHILTELAEMCDTVGIIERGQLLATGTVEAIQRQQQTHREVLVRVLDREAEAAAWLQQRDELSDVRRDGHLIRFSHRLEREEEAAWLRQLVEHGFSVAEFRSENKSLEDVFMTVTKGLVQ